MSKNKKDLKTSREYTQLNYEVGAKSDKKNVCEKEKHQPVHKSSKRSAWLELIVQLLAIIVDYFEFQTAFELPAEIGHVKTGIAIVRCCWTFLK